MQAGQLMRAHAVLQSTACALAKALWLFGSVAVDPGVCCAAAFNVPAL